MDRLTRHELKQDDFRETLDQLEQYLKAHLKEILTVPSWSLLWWAWRGD